MARHGNTSGLYLIGGHPALLKGLESIIAKIQIDATGGLAAAMAAVLLPEFDFLRH